MKHIPQIFSLPSPTITYLLEATSHQVLKKLYQTCKYFYARLKIRIVGEYGVSNHMSDSGEGSYMRGFGHIINIGMDYEYFGRLWVTEELRIFRSTFNIIPTIVKCDIQTLRIDFYKLTLNEFKFLTASGNVEELNLWGNVYYNYLGDVPVPIEDLYPFVPKATDIVCNSCPVTKKTLEKLLALDYPRKIKCMCWSHINQSLDPATLDVYLKKVLTEKASLYLSFKNPDVHEVMEKRISKKIALWSPERSKMHVDLRRHEDERD